MRDYDEKFGTKTALNAFDKQELCERNTANLNILNYFKETACYQADAGT